MLHSQKAREKFPSFSLFTHFLISYIGCTALHLPVNSLFYTAAHIENTTLFAKANRVVFLRETDCSYWIFFVYVHAAAGFFS